MIKDNDSTDDGCGRGILQNITTLSLYSFTNEANFTSSPTTHKMKTMGVEMQD